jgi:hypothetical protein
MADGIDYGRLAQELLRTLEAPGREYEGAPYVSKDPGTSRYMEGQVEPDVGWLDPVDMLAGSLAAPARAAVKALGRNLTQPGPSMRPLLGSQRGSTGGGMRARMPDPDAGIPAELRADIRNVRERIRGGMAEYSEQVGDYDNPDIMARMQDDLVQGQGESLLAYLKRLARLEQEYDPDQIYGPGEYPPSRLPEILGMYSKTPAGLADAKALATVDPIKRTVELGALSSAPQPSRANEYADIIRKLFEQGGR